MVETGEEAVLYRARLHRLLFLRPFLWILLGLALLVSSSAGHGWVPWSRPTRRPAR